jgi:hypothetical protein
MVAKKSKGILRIEFLDTDHEQILLANYLRATGDAKGAVFQSTKRSLYALALSKDGTKSKQELEMALSIAITDLQSQIKTLTEHFRIFESIELPCESSNRSLISTPIYPSIPPSIPSVGRVVEEEEEDEDDDEDDGYLTLTNTNTNIALNF